MKSSEGAANLFDGVNNTLRLLNRLDWNVRKRIQLRRTAMVLFPVKIL